MIIADVDMNQLTRSLEMAGKRFGETNEQAIARWGIQVGRELAGETQVHRTKKQDQAGSTTFFGYVIKPMKGTKGVQRTAMEADMLNCMIPMHTKWLNRFKRTDRKIIKNANEALRWVEKNRNRKGRIPKRESRNKAFVSITAMKAALRMKTKEAGKAKGAWVGATLHMATKQKGRNQIMVSRSTLAYTKRFRSKGRARTGGTQYVPWGDMINEYRHTRSNYVLSKAATDRAIIWGARKTVTWYNRAAKAALNK